MKENILDVLIYLFENYPDDEFVPETDQESVKTRLAQDGFNATVVDRAFTWLEGLAPVTGDIPEHLSDGYPSVRLFTPMELQRLDVECRGFLLFLEQLGILDSISRELVIDRTMALDSEEIDLEQMKWVVQMVLFNQSEKLGEFSWAASQADLSRH